MTKKKTPFSYLFVTMLFFTALIHVWQRVQLVRLGYALENLKLRIAEEENENKLLRIKMQHLSSLERVDKIAKGKLGMISPPPENIIYLQEE